MRMRAYWEAGILLAGVCLAASHASAGEPNVILITFDGVRSQEFFDKANLPRFWSKRVAEGVVFGRKELGSRVTIDNAAHISLPAYHNLMAGAPQPCMTNDCGRIGVETLGERLVRELKLPHEKVAAISSWSKIPLAFERAEGATFTNGGFDELKDGGGDPDLARINRLQLEDRPVWKENRFDKYTIAHAMRYLGLHRPRFLYISINDTDDWAHLDDLPRTKAALVAYDEWLERLFAQLESMGEYGRDTTVVITTDHGRGEGKEWKDHRASIPGARDIWLYARGPKTSRVGVLRGGPTHTHSDVRPTIEVLMGLKPVDCQGCGKPIAEIAKGRGLAPSP
jgi:hypothetical protein